MKKMTLLFTAFLFAVSNIIAQAPPTTSWNDYAETQWYNTIDASFNITSAAQFAGLSVLVAGGNTFSGKKINLQSNLDLAAHLWTPIGENAENPFSGEMNGNNFIISNLFVNLPGVNWVGLFGRCVTATLKNIRLENPYIRGEDSAGALSGNVWNNGTILNCHATGINLISTGDNVGGLVGDLVGGCTVYQCSAEGDVTGSLQVGGFIGSPYDSNIITECFSAGTVTASYIAGGFTGASVVGFPGTNNSIIENCYSRSNVTVTSGIVGGFIGGFSSLLVIKNSYSTGTVNGPDTFGGFIGAAGNVNGDNNYWDTESSLLLNDVGEWTGGTAGNSSATPKTTSEMKSNATVDALNQGSTVWKLNPEENDGYPTFTAAVAAANEISSINTNVKVYPNVFDSEITISAEKTLKGYVIYDITGKAIQAGSLEGNQALVNTAGIISGVYVLIINTDNETISTKIIK